MIPEMLAAAAVGISFSNAWLCMGLSFGTRGGGGPSVGVRFILGRFIGLLLIGVAISTVGAVTDIPPIYFVAVFGAGSVLFGALMLAGIFGGPGPLKRRLRHALGLSRGDGCKDGGSAIDGARGDGRQAPALKPKGAFLLGVMRGATPCVKLMVLAPLLIAVGPLWAVALTIVYALASSAYPIIGFLAASTLSYLPRYERAARVAGASLMILIGVYMVLNELALYSSARGD
jgi:hypothetical protein